MAHGASAAGIGGFQHFAPVAACGKNPLYSFFVEFGRCHANSKERLIKLLQELDRVLRELNVDYAQKRESRALPQPVLVRDEKPGWFQRKANCRSPVRNARRATSRRSF